MPPDAPDPKATDVPALIFGQFISKLQEAKLPSEVVARLNETLLVDHAFTEASLRSAIFGGQDEP